MQKGKPYKEEFLQALYLSDRMYLTCCLGTKPAHVLARCETFLDGKLSASWRG